jgi:hypothetical protein
MILDVCREPHTVQDLADKWGASYWTVYRDVKELVKTGRLKEMPYKKDRKMQFLSIADEDERGHLLYRGNGRQTYTLSELTGAAEVTGTLAFRTIARALAHLYMRSFGLVSGQGHLRGVVTTVETKAQIRQLLRFLKLWVTWLEQILMADIWDEDNEKFVEQFGPADPGEMTMLAAEYNSRDMKYRPQVVGDEA